MAYEPIQKLRLQSGRCWVHSEVIGRLKLVDVQATIDDVLKTNPSVTFKNDRRSEVTRVEAAGQHWVVKRYKMNPVKNALYHFARLSPAWRELRGAGELHRAGLRGVMPLALVHHFAGQTMILPYVEGQTLDAWLRSRVSPRRIDRERAKAIGRQIGRIAAAGLINRDYKPTNLILETHDPPDAEPTIIDPAGIRRFKSADQVDEMLSVLVRAALRVGLVGRTEMLACCQAALEACPSIAADPKILLRRVAKATEARPLSYDPVTGKSHKA